MKDFHCYNEGVDVESLLIEVSSKDDIMELVTIQDYPIGHFNSDIEGVKGNLKNMIIGIYIMKFLYC